MKKTFIIITIVLYFAYEVICMRNMVYLPLGIGWMKSSVPVFVLAISLLISSLLIYKKHNKSAFIGSFIVLQIYVYLISLFHGLLYIDDYLVLLLPVFLILWGRQIAFAEVNKTTQVLIVLGFVVLVYMFFRLERFSLGYGDKDYYHSNSSYFLLCFLPLLLLNKSIIIKYGSMVITILVLLVSAKRGGTIAIALGLLLYLLVERNIQINKRKRLSRIIGVAILLIGIYYVVGRVSETTDNYFLNRFMESSDDAERGRASIYPTVFAMIQNSSFGEICFGHGYDMVKQNNPIGLSAHNDFLEITYDIGVFGLLLLLFFLYHLIKYLSHLIKNKSPYASSFAFSIGVLLTCMMVSHIFFSQDLLMIYAFYYGYFVGTNELNNSIITKTANENRSFSVSVSH